MMVCLGQGWKGQEYVGTGWIVGGGEGSTRDDTWVCKAIGSFYSHYKQIGRGNCDEIFCDRGAFIYFLKKN